MSGELVIPSAPIAIHGGELKSSTDGDCTNPAIGFHNDLTTGVFLESSGNMGFAANGNEIMRVSDDTIYTFKPITLTDSQPDDVVLDTMGKLHKKPGHNGLFWKTIEGEVDLTEKVVLDDNAIKLLLKDMVKDIPIQDNSHKVQVQQQLELQRQQQELYQQQQEQQLQQELRQQQLQYDETHKLIKKLQQQIDSININASIDSVFDKLSSKLEINEASDLEIVVSQKPVVSEQSKTPLQPINVQPINLQPPLLPERSNNLDESIEIKFKLAELSKTVDELSKSVVETKIKTVDDIIKVKNQIDSQLENNNKVIDDVTRKMPEVTRKVSDELNEVRVNTNKLISELSKTLDDTNKSLNNIQEKIQLTSNDISIKFDGKLSAQFQKLLTIINTPICIGQNENSMNAPSNKGLLYSNPDGSLIWKTGETENRIDKQQISWPLNVPSCSDLPSIVFHNNLGIYATDKSLKLGNSLEVSDKVSVNILEIAEQKNTNHDNPSTGLLYKEAGTGDLIWNTGTPVNLSKKSHKVLATPGNLVSTPDISFTTDSDTGLFLADNDVLASVAGGHIKMAVASNEIIMYDTMVLKDSDTAGPTLSSEGHLYKKANVQGLFWKTNTSETDLTKTQWPLNAPQTDSKLAPSYGFYGSPGTGLSAIGMTGMCISVLGQAVVDISRDLFAVHQPIGLGNSKLFVEEDSLIWENSTGKHNLLKTTKFPLIAPDGTIVSPSYTFSSDTTSGLSMKDKSLVWSINGQSKVSIDEMGLTVVGDIFAEVIDFGSGRLRVSDGQLIWKTSAGEIYLSRSSETFNGGVVTNAIDAPGYLLNKWWMFSDNDKFIISDPIGNECFNISLDGIEARNIMFADNETILENSNQVVYVNIKQNRTVGFRENALDVYTPIQFNVGEERGILKKIGNDLVWCTDNNEVNLTESKLQFPLIAPAGQSYGFADSTVQIKSQNGELIFIVGSQVKDNSPDNRQDDNSRQDDKRPDNLDYSPNPKLEYASSSAPQLSSSSAQTQSLQSPVSSICKILSDGSIQTTALHTNLIKSDDDLQLSGRNININGCLKVSSVVIPASDKQATLGFNTDLGNVGLVYEDKLQLATGSNDNIQLTDNEVVLGNRQIKFKDGFLSVKDNELIWESYGRKMVLSKLPEKQYNGELMYKAGSNVRIGDVICVDAAGLVHNGLGGRTIPLDIKFEGSAKSLDVFPIDDVSFHVAYVKCHVVGDESRLTAVWHMVDKDTMKSLMSSFIIYRSTADPSLKDTSPDEIYGKILQITSDKYVVVYLVPGENILRVVIVNNPFGVSSVSKPVVVALGSKCDNMTAEYDLANHMIVIACYSMAIQNFVVALLNVEDTIEIGTVQENVAQMPISDMGKQIHLVLIPGGSCVVSYGICKVVFMVSSVNAPVTSGENFLDYESVDCVDMLYNENNGNLMSLEKTVSGSCYIQILDVLGLTVQKQTSKGFRNANMEPIGIAYNSILASYIMVYALGNSVYVQHFEYDGLNITTGLRYLDSSAEYKQSLCRSGNYVKHGRSVHEIPGMNLSLYEFDRGVCIFEDNYHGNPSGFLGLAMNASELNRPCKVMIKGHVYTTSSPLPSGFVGKKLYLVDPTKEFPSSVSTNPMNGIFIGTCLDIGHIILGL